MPQVTIPASHFTNSVRRHYNRPDVALVRELLQNAVDANATVVKFNLSNVGDAWHLTCLDDGCGMTKDILVKALLTMSGSFKGPNSIGGFGAAKEIILFQHGAYKVTTCKDGVSTCVIGAQLDYEFHDCDLVADGTFIDLTFHEDYKLDSDEFCTEIEAFLCKCNPSCKIFWNDEEVKPQFTGWEINDPEDWCNVVCHETQYSTCYVWVRIKGILMFEAYVGSSKTQVAIELTKPSTDILTVNRDGFTWQYTEKVGVIVNKITMEKENYGKAYNTKLNWRGKNRNFEPVDFDRVFSDKSFDESAALAFSVGLAKTVEAIQTTDPGASRAVIRDRLQDKARNIANDLGLSNESMYDAFKVIDDMVCDLYADFVVHVRGKGFDKIPDHLTPNKMGKKYTKLAKLWKHCIKIVMEATDTRVDYRIGWVIDHDESVYATHQNIDDVHTFLLNPVLTWMNSSNHMAVFNEILLIACHEVTHVKHLYHDESFTISIHKNIHAVLCAVNGGTNSWWKEYQAANDEIL
jgi:hypothetical protein